MIKMTNHHAPANGGGNDLLGVRFDQLPVQQPHVVARKMVEGIETGKKFVSPNPLFAVSKVLMGVCPPVRTVYWGLEKAKLERFKQKLIDMGINSREVAELGVEAVKNVLKK